MGTTPEEQIKELVNNCYTEGVISQAIEIVSLKFGVSASVIRKIYYGHRKVSAELLKKMEKNHGR
jgi:hypothetical protein